MRLIKTRAMKKVCLLLLCLLSSGWLFTQNVSAEAVSSRMTPPQIKSLVRYNDGTAKLTWTTRSHAIGYQVSWSVCSDFSQKTVKTLKGKSKSSYTLSKSQLSTTGATYFRIRSYRKTTAGKLVYSKWSRRARVVVLKSSWKYAGNSKIHSGAATLYQSTATTRKKITVAVNAGHGTSGGSSVYTLSHPDGSGKVTGGTNAKGAVYSMAVSTGTTVGGASEASVNLKVAMKLKDLLLKNGYDVLMIRQTDNVQLDNIARTVIANKGADCHIAIHYDGTRTDKGAYYCSVPNVSSYRNMMPVAKMYRRHEKLGKCLISGLAAANVKIYSGGKLEMDLTQTSYSTIPSVDIEVGDRASSTSDAQLNRVAKGLFAGIKKYFAG